MSRHPRRAGAAGGGGGGQPGSRAGLGHSSRRDTAASYRDHTSDSNSNSISNTDRDRDRDRDSDRGYQQQQQQQQRDYPRVTDTRPPGGHPARAHSGRAAAAGRGEQYASYADSRVRGGRGSASASSSSSSSAMHDRRRADETTAADVSAKAKADDVEEGEIRASSPAAHAPSTSTSAAEGAAVSLNTSKEQQRASTPSNVEKKQPSPSPPPSPEVSEEERAARRRARRAAILAKYAATTATTSTADAAAATNSTSTGTSSNGVDKTVASGSIASAAASVPPPPQAAAAAAAAAAAVNGGRRSDDDTHDVAEGEREKKRIRLETPEAAAPPLSIGNTSRVPPTAPPALAHPSGNERRTTPSSSSSSAGMLALEKREEAQIAQEQQQQQQAFDRGGRGDGGGVEAQGEPEISAADYNPDDDRREDDRRWAAHRDDGKKQATQGHDDDDDDELVEEEYESDEDDMFSIGSKPKKTRLVKRKKSGGTFIPVIHRAADERASGGALQDNYDDADGYYKSLLGETLDGGRYHVHANVGKGMFSSVVRARDARPEKGQSDEVAIKIVRSQESMFKAGQKEAAILRKLLEADPQDKKHVVRLHRTFEHRGHLCLVFESLSINLREVVKRYGRDVGISLRAVRVYASQLLLALSLLRKCEILHADVKPDNILVNETRSLLKLCDLGSAADVVENDITPYLVSRFYRAPEIILGLPYDYAIDMWSVGCSLYELYTGKILFPGRTNNHMLQLMMELKGKLPHKLIRRGQFGLQHFDDATLSFTTVDKNDVAKVLSIPAKPAHDLRARLMPPGVAKKLKEDELKLLTSFVDLLDKMLALEPAKRITPKDALNHPFLRA